MSVAASNLNLAGTAELQTWVSGVTATKIAAEVDDDNTAFSVTIDGTSYTIATPTANTTAKLVDKLNASTDAAVAAFTWLPQVTELLLRLQIRLVTRQLTWQSYLGARLKLSLVPPRQMVVMVLKKLMLPWTQLLLTELHWVRHKLSLNRLYVTWRMWQKTPTAFAS